MTEDRITALPDGRIRHVRGTWSTEFSAEKLPSKVALYERLAVMCETKSPRPNHNAAADHRLTVRALRDAQRAAQNNNPNEVV